MMLKTGVTVDVLWRGLFPLAASNNSLLTLGRVLGPASTWSITSAPATRRRHGNASLCVYDLGFLPRNRHRLYSTASGPELARSRPAATSLAHDYVKVPREILLAKPHEDSLPDGLKTITDPGRADRDGLVTLECADIMAHLRWLRDERPHLGQAAGFWAQVLKPCVAYNDLLIDDSILRAQAHTEGNAAVVAQILSEAEEAAYNPPSSTFHYALRALAIHPDYILRNRILNRMRLRHIQLSPEGHVSVALGLLRDGQHELAIDRLEQIVGDDIEIPPWVYDVFIFAFAELGFHDEVLRIASHRLSGQKDSALPSAETCYFLLDKFSSAYHYDGTKFIWNLAVPKMVNPPDGVLENVINAAARGVDPMLASQALRMLASRGTHLGLHHYEPLIDCYVGVRDLEKAMSVLCIMHRAGVKPETGSTRALYHLLKTKEPHELTETARLLFRLKTQGPVPISAFNVVLEATFQRSGLGPAMDLYKRVRLIVESGPDAETFNAILGMLWTETPENSVETIDFLAKEMSVMDVRPNRLTYEYMIHNLARANHLEAALESLREMARTFDRTMGRAGWISKENVLFLIRRFVKTQNREASQYVRMESKARGLTVDMDNILSRDGARGAASNRDSGLAKQETTAAASANVRVARNTRRSARQKFN